MEHEEFMKIVREHNEWRRHPERWTEAERLCEEIMSSQKTNEEWLALQEEVQNFFQSDASEDDKQLVRGYTESLAMVCSAIREGKL